MTGKMNEMDEYVKRWLVKANNDLKVAENEMKLPPDDMVTEAICFHCEQAFQNLFLKSPNDSEVSRKIFKNIPDNPKHRI